jgi:hypothetical protein
VVEVRGSRGTQYTVTPFPNYPACKGCLTVTDSSGFIHRVIDEAGKDLPAYDFIKGWKIFDLPLAQGKKWSYTATLPSGVKLEHSYEVLGLTKIKIAAGEFEVFEVKRTAKRSDVALSTTQTLYYSPELWVTVKFVGDYQWEVKEVK